MQYEYHVVIQHLFLINVTPTSHTKLSVTSQGNVCRAIEVFNVCVCLSDRNNQQRQEQLN